MTPAERYDGPSDPESPGVHQHLHRLDCGCLKCRKQRVEAELEPYTLREDWRMR